MRAWALLALGLVVAGCSANGGQGPDGEVGGSIATGGGGTGGAAGAATGGTSGTDPGTGGSAGSAGTDPGTGGAGAGGSAGSSGGTAGNGAAGNGGSGATGGTAGNGGSGATGGTAGSGGSGATGGTGGSGGASGAGATWGNSAALPALGSLVILGDSISDGGGQAPFYYDRLRQDLTARYGAITYRHEAESGSETSALDNQVNRLPAHLPGPVAVCISSGGNDMKANILQVALGLDAPFIATLGANIQKAYDLLLAPGRFGAGVPVYVFELNIYDASDGQGNFAAHSCAFGSGFPALATDPYFARWNTEIGARAAGAGQYPVDLWGHFRNHGFNHPPSWFASDCTHPNSTGHDQIRRLFYWKITGQMLP